MRYFDVTDLSDVTNKIFYEFKSVSKVPPTDFSKQFLKDLSHKDVTSLDQIKWIFDGKKNPTGTRGKTFEKAMEVAIEAVQIDDNIARKLLKNSKATADDLKDVLISRSKEIFLIAE